MRIKKINTLPLFLFCLGAAPQAAPAVQVNVAKFDAVQLRADINLHLRTLSPSLGPDAVIKSLSQKILDSQATPSQAASGCVLLKALASEQAMEKLTTYLGAPATLDNFRRISGALNADAQDLAKAALDKIFANQRSQAAADAGAVFGSLHEGPRASGLAPSEKWKLNIEAPAVAAPVFTGGFAYVLNENGLLLALDAASGKEAWRYKLEEALPYSPVVQGGWIYIASVRGTVVALDAKTGAVQGKFAQPIKITSPLTIVDKTAYFGAQEGFAYLYSADIVTGKTNWRFKTGDKIGAAPDVDAKTISALSYDGFINTVSRDDGQEIRRKIIGGEAMTAILKDGRIYYWKLNRDDGVGNLMGMSIENGRTYLSATVPNPVGLPPIIAGSELYLWNNTGSLYAIGKNAETAPLQLIIFNPTAHRAGPVIADGKAVFAHSFGTHIFGVDIGQRIDAFDAVAVEGLVPESLAVDQGIIYYSTYDGKLHALPIPEPTLSKAP